MPSFDTSDVAAHVVPPNQEQSNPFDTIGKFAQVQNELNQNKLFQAKALAGQYLAQSTGPDGTPNFNQFTSAIQADPRTSAFAPEILQDAQNIRKTGLENQQSGVNLAQSQMTNLRQDLATAGTSSPTGDPKENILAATQALIAGRNSGRYTKEMADAAAGNLPNLIRSSIISGAGGTGAQEALAGIPQEIQTGNSQRAVIVDRYTGQQTNMSGNAAVIQDEMTPAERAQRVNIIGPGNVPEQVPQSQLTDVYGNPILTPGLTGSHGETQTGLAPGVAESEVAVRKNQTDTYNRLTDQANDTPDRKALINNLLTAAENTRTNPQAINISNLVTTANAVLGTHFSEKDASATQLIQAISSQLIENQEGIVGKSSNNSNLVVANLANPNPTIANETIKELGALLLGNQDAIQAQKNAADHWEKKGGTPEEFQQFKNQWNRIDPRVFQEKYLTPLQRQELISSMSDQDKQKYLQSKSRLLKYGWLNQ